MPICHHLKLFECQKCHEKWRIGQLMWLQCGSYGTGHGPSANLSKLKDYVMNTKCHVEVHFFHLCDYIYYVQFYLFLLLLFIVGGKYLEEKDWFFIFNPIQNLLQIVNLIEDYPEYDFCLFEM